MGGRGGCALLTHPTGRWCRMWWVRYAYPPYKVGNPDVSVGRVSEAHPPDNIFTTFT